MKPSEKVKKDIIFILNRLMDYLHQHHQESLLTNYNIKAVENILYRFYSLNYRYKNRFIDLFQGTIHPRHQKILEQEIILFQSSLIQSLRLCNRAAAKKIISSPNASRKFIHVGIPSREVHKKMMGCRLYLNSRFDSVHILIQRIIERIDQEMKREVKCPKCERMADKILCDICGTYLPKSYPINFKFADPYSEIYWPSQLMRADQIVLWLPSEKKIVRDVLNWFNGMKSNFNEEVPLFTHRLDKGIGYASETTKEHKNYYGSMVSFGQMICFLIAESLSAWCLHNKQIPEEKDYSKIANWIYREVMRKRHKIKFTLGMK